MRCKMKGVIVVLALFLVHALSYAQSPTGKGTYTVGGSASFSSQTYDNMLNDISEFIVNPQLGYFFADNFYSAISINYYRLSTRDIVLYQLGVGPAVRYYFSTEKIKPFIGLGYNYIKYTDSGNSSEIKISGGVNYFVTEYFALEASINYSFFNYNQLNTSMYNSVHSKLLLVAFGVNYFIYNM